MAGTKPPEQINITLGTAGHIDHGKTALVKCLTGCDTDRLKAEKERGMSIDLGFAPCRIADMQVGIVDVPGHENFIKTMVAGASGIDAVILVVAADDGVMPQTREHLDILTLLGVRHGLVALTKIDRVDPDHLEIARAELEDFLRGTFLEGAPIRPVSSVTGEGFDAFYGSLVSLVEAIRPKPADGVFRLPLDRAFSAKGFGTVVAGIPVSGSARTGDEVVLLPQGITGRIKRIEVYGRTAETVVAGQCAAINIGHWDPKSIRRGDTLTLPGYFSPQNWHVGELRLLWREKSVLKSGAEVKFHTGTSEVTASVYSMKDEVLRAGDETPALREGPPSPHGRGEAGQAADKGAMGGLSALVDSGAGELPLAPREAPAVTDWGAASLRRTRPVAHLVQIRSKNPIVAGPGDHFILRTLSPARTIGGGMIIEALSKRLKRNRPEVYEDLLERAQAVRDARRFVEYCARKAESLAASEADLAARVKIPLPRVRRILADLCAQEKVVPLSPQLYIHRDIQAEVQGRVLKAVADFHAQAPESPGITLGQLQQTVCLDKAVLDAIVASLQKEGRLVERSGRLAAPDHRSTFREEDAQRLEVVESLFRQHPFRPPSLAELIDKTGANQAAVEKILRILREHQRLVPVAEGLWFHQEAVDRAAQILLDFIRKEGKLESVKFKYLLDTTRKFAIPLLDYLDRLGTTRRVGNTRYLRSPPNSAKKEND